MGTVVHLPKAKGTLDIYRTGHGLRCFDANVPIDLGDIIFEMIKAADTPIRFDWQDDSEVIPRPRGKGIIDIYNAGPGLRGFEGMLPIKLADQIISIVKAAGVPVRFEWQHDSEVIALP